MDKQWLNYFPHHRHFNRHYKKYLAAAIIYLSALLILCICWLIERREGMDCGIATEEMKSLVINGSEAPLGFAPWYVALKKKSSGMIFCGGTIISREWVLTASHCIQGACPNNRIDCLLVIAGSQSTRDNNAGTIHEVIDIKVVDALGTSYLPTNDIALLRVSPRFKYRKHIGGNSRGIAPACLPKQMEKVTEREAVVAGFGRSSMFHILRPRKLLASKATILDWDYCFYLQFKSNTTKFANERKLICIGSLEDHKSVCRGDSGGPLTVVRNGAYTLIGLLATVWNTGCEEGAMFTNVATYRYWIEYYTGV